MNDRFKFRTYIPDFKFFKYWGWIGNNHHVGLCAYSAYSDYQTSELLEKYTNQCTGLRDKNGQLIYEGDIIQIQGCTEKAKVEYNLEKGMFLLVGKKYAPSAFMTIRKDYWEVIGNIYENKELLDE